MCSEADSGEACDKSRTAHSEVASFPPVPYKEIKREQTGTNKNNEQTNNANNEALLVQALHSTVDLTRLPVYPSPQSSQGTHLSSESEAQVSRH